MEQTGKTFARVPLLSWVLWAASLGMPLFFLAAYLLSSAVRNADLPEIFLVQPALCSVASFLTKFSVPLRILLAILTTIVSLLVWIVGIPVYYAVMSGLWRIGGITISR